MNFSPMAMLYARSTRHLVWNPRLGGVALHQGIRLTWLLATMMAVHGILTILLVASEPLLLSHLFVQLGDVLNEKKKDKRKNEAQERKDDISKLNTVFTPQAMILRCQIPVIGSTGGFKPNPHVT